MSDDRLPPALQDGPIPRHVAVIMDGNGRWAADRGLPRRAGHEAGMNAVREVVQGSVEVGIRTLTLFAFSTENWQRPAQEVLALMTLLRLYSERERDELRSKGVEVRVFGDLTRLDQHAREAVALIEEVTSGGSSLRLNLMISYSGRQDIVGAARRLAERAVAGELAPEDIDVDRFSEELVTRGQPDPDLLIRTSGEFRISNFLLWQLAYAEIVITPVLWPDFSRQDLFAAIDEFQRRERRFGRISSHSS